MQSGRVKTVITIQHSLDGKRDVKRLMKTSGKRIVRHAESQVIRTSIKCGNFEDLDIAVHRPAF